MPAAGAWAVSKAHVLTTPSRRPLTQRLLFQKGPRTDAPIVAPSSELADESEQKIGSIALRPHVALKPTQCHLARQSASTPGSVPGDLGCCVQNALLSEGGRGWCWRRRPVPGPRDPSELNSGGGGPSVVTAEQPRDLRQQLRTVAPFPGRVPHAGHRALHCSPRIVPHARTDEETEARRLPHSWSVDAPAPAPAPSLSHRPAVCKPRPTPPDGSFKTGRGDRPTRSACACDTYCFLKTAK